MKKLFLLSLSLFAIAAFATPITFEKYVSDDYASIKGKTTSTDTCVAERYKSLFTTIEKVKNNTTVRNEYEGKVKNFCNNGCKNATSFTYKGVNRNAVVLAKTTEPSSCKGNTSDAGKYGWFVDCSECKDLSFNTTGNTGNNGTNGTNGTN